jgi:hypothetical protein
LDAQKEILPHRIDEMVAEIAAILSRGFMKDKINMRLAADSGSLESDGNHFEESKALVEKRFDCSAHQSVHALKG